MRRLSRVSDENLYVIPRTSYNALELIVNLGGRGSDVTARGMFPTSHDPYIGEYGELWRPVDQYENLYRLDSVQFYIKRHRGPELKPEEIVAFHWQPMANVDRFDGAGFVCRPHFHLSTAADPLAKSHLVATLTVPPDEQNNVEYLDCLLDEAIETIAVEILVRLDG